MDDGLQYRGGKDPSQKTFTFANFPSTPSFSHQARSSLYSTGRFSLAGCCFSLAYRTPEQLLHRLGPIFSFNYREALTFIAASCGVATDTAHLRLPRLPLGRGLASSLVLAGGVRAGSLALP